MSKIQIDITGKRVAILGKTGSGKTALSQMLLSSENKPVMVADPKGTFQWPMNPYMIKVTSVNDLSGMTHPYICYSPNVREVRDPEAWEAFFRAAYYRGNVRLYVDEVYGIMIHSRTPPPAFEDCITRGRELGVDVMCASQRPVFIPGFVLSESEVYFVFHLMKLEDRKRVAELLGDAVTVSPVAAMEKSLVKNPHKRKIMNSYLGKYPFWYYHAKLRQPILMRGLFLPYPDIDIPDVSAQQPTETEIKEMGLPAYA